MGDETRLVIRAGNATDASALVPIAQDTDSQARGAQSASDATASVITVSKAALEAWTQHYQKLTPEERIAMDHYIQDNPSPLAYLKAIQDACTNLQQNSRIIKAAKSVEPFFKSANQYMPIATSVGQADHSATFVLGAISCIMNICVNFSEFQQNLGELLADVIEKMEILLQYDLLIFQKEPQIQNYLVLLYCDILDISKMSIALFWDSKAQRPRSGTKTLTASLKEKFESRFKPIEEQFRKHMENFRYHADICNTLHDRAWKQGMKDSMQYVNSTLQDLALLQGDELRHVNAPLRPSMLIREESQLNPESHEYVVSKEAYQMREQQWQRAIAWLPSISFQKAHDRHCNQHLKGTGQWLLNKEEFTNWKSEQKSGILWLKGKRGCGKSILASQVIDDLDSSNCRLAYIYCGTLREQTGNATDPENESLVFLGSIVEQLCRIADEPDSTLEDMYRRSRSDNFRNEPPGWQQMKKALLSVVSKLSNAFIVIDGLDECQEQEKISKLLTGLVDDASFVVKIVIFSRPQHPGLESNLSAQLEIKADSGANDGDIKDFIDQKLTTLPIDPNTNHHLLQEMREKLFSKAKGMFLWVDLVMKSLKRQRVEDGFLSAIDSIPMDLDENFELALQKMSLQRRDARDLALRILLWTTNSRRPLSTNEILEAVAISPAITTLKGKRLLSAQGLTTQCADLVEIDKDGHFHLIHSSLRQYLLNLPVNGPEHVETFRRMQSSADRILGEACISYLQLDELNCSPIKSESDLEQIMQRFPLVAYAAENWGSHIAAARNNDLNKKALAFAQNKSAREFAMLVALAQGIFREDIYSSERRALFAFPGGTTALHFLALHGLVEVARVLPNVTASIRYKDNQGTTPLDYAVYGAHKDMCVWFLDLAIKLTPNLGPLSGRISILHQAAHYSWPDVFEKSLELGEDVEREARKSESTSTPLHIAAVFGSEHMLKTILKTNTNLECKDTSGYTPLLTAAIVDQAANVETLLEAGADITATGNTGENAIHHATRNKNVPLIQYLWSKGAAIDCQDNELHTPLHIAAWYDVHDAIEFLARAEVDINGKSRSGMTPLHLAAKNGSMNATLALLRNGALASVYDDYNGALPLHFAVANGHLEIVKHYILKEAIDVGVRDGNDGYTPAHFAAIFGHTDILAFLWGQGAAVDSQTTRIGHSALHVAAQKGNLETVKKLLDEGANPNLQSFGDSTPLHYAARLGHQEMLNLLLDRGSLPNSQKKNGSTPLHDGVKSGSTGIVTELLKYLEKNEVNMAQREGLTALHMAATKGFIDLVRILLDHGAQSRKDNDGNLPLHWAALEGHLDVMECLSTPETILTTNYFEQSVLYQASAGGHVDVVRFLIDHGAIHGSKGGRVREPLLAHGTPVFAAVLHNHEDVFNLLIESGLNGQHSRDARGLTCFHAAALNGNIEILNTLATSGADFHASDAFGNNAMTMAAYEGHVHILDRLIELEVDPHCCNANFTPLGVAASNGYLHLVEKLISLGVDVDKTSKDFMESALILASSSGHSQTSLFLLRAGANPYLRDVFGFNSIEYAARHPPTLKLFEKALKNLNTNNMNNISRCEHLRSAIRRFTALILALQTKLEVREKQMRRTYVEYLGTALVHLDRYDPDHGYDQAAKFCFMEVIFTPQHPLGPYFVTCQMCMRRVDRSDVFICLECPDTRLCELCHSRYINVRESSKRPSLGFSSLENLEREVLNIRQTIFVPENGLLALSDYLILFNEIISWIRAKSEAYEAWENNFNADKHFKYHERQGKRFIQTLSKLLLKEETGETDLVEDTLTISKKAGNRKEQLGLEAMYQQQYKEILRGQEFQDFICSGHRFLPICKLEWEQHNNDRSTFDENGLLSENWFRGLSAGYAETRNISETQKEYMKASELPLIHNHGETRSDTSPPTSDSSQNAMGSDSGSTTALLLLESVRRNDTKVESQPYQAREANGLHTGNDELIDLVMETVYKIAESESGGILSESEALLVKVFVSLVKTSNLICPGSGNRVAKDVLPDFLESVIDAARLGRMNLFQRLRNKAKLFLKSFAGRRKSGKSK